MALLDSFKVVLSCFMDVTYFVTPLPINGHWICLQRVLYDKQHCRDHPHSGLSARV